MKYKILIGLVVLGGLGGGVYVLSGYVSPAVPTDAIATGPESAPQEILLTSLTPDKFMAQLRDGSERVVLDVRTQGEFESGHLPGSVVVDFYAPDFREQLDALDKDVPYAVYCRSGNRSGQTLSIMRNLGFSNVIDLEGGVVAFLADGSRTLCTSC